MSNIPDRVLTKVPSVAQMNAIRGALVAAHNAPFPGKPTGGNKAAFQLKNLQDSVKDVIKMIDTDTN